MKPRLVLIGMDCLGTRLVRKSAKSEARAKPVYLRNPNCLAPLAAVVLFVSLFGSGCKQRVRMGETRLTASQKEMESYSDLLNEYGLTDALLKERAPQRNDPPVLDQEVEGSWCEPVSITSFFENILTSKNLARSINLAESSLAAISKREQDIDRINLTIGYFDTKTYEEARNYLSKKYRTDFPESEKDIGWVTNEGGKPWIRWQPGNKSSPVTSLRDLIEALYVKQVPVIAHVEVNESWDNSRSGLIDPYSQKSPGENHVIVIVRLTKDHLVFRNSWGTKWGHAGYGYYPIEAIGKKTPAKFNPFGYYLNPEFYPHEAEPREPKDDASRTRFIPYEEKRSL